MPITHRSTSDPKYVVDAPTLYTFKCVLCGYDTAQFSGTSEVCPTCKQYSMRQHETVTSSKVQKIMNRTGDGETAYKGDKYTDLWDEGMVPRNIRTTVRPIAGSGELRILGNANRDAWLEKVVQINGSWYRLNDLGAALKDLI